MSARDIQAHVERELALPRWAPEDPLSREAGAVARNGLFRLEFPNLVFRRTGADREEVDFHVEQACPDSGHTSSHGGNVF